MTCKVMPFRPILPLGGGDLLFTTKFPEISATHFIDLGRMIG